MLIVVRAARSTLRTASSPFGWLLEETYSTPFSFFINRFKLRYPCSLPDLKLSILFFPQLLSVLAEWTFSFVVRIYRYVYYGASMSHPRVKYALAPCVANSDLAWSPTSASRWSDEYRGLHTPYRTSVRRRCDACISAQVIEVMNIGRCKRVAMASAHLHVVIEITAALHEPTDGCNRS